jgi:hypothetical protein
MAREEPSLETLWLKNIRTMDKFQITDHSNCKFILLRPMGVKKQSTR